MVKIMKKEKLYFPEWDDCICSDLEDLKLEAKERDLTEFAATEAVPDKMIHTDVYWCTEHGDFVDKYECCKPECEDYIPNKSGHGVCLARGHCYLHSTKVICVKV